MSRSQLRVHAFQGVVHQLGHGLVRPVQDPRSNDTVECADQGSSDDGCVGDLVVVVRKISLSERVKTGEALVVEVAVTASQAGGLEVDLVGGIHGLGGRIDEVGDGPESADASAEARARVGGVFARDDFVEVQDSTPRARLRLAEPDG
jgi:hypothetical protein